MIRTFCDLKPLKSILPTSLLSNVWSKQGIRATGAGGPKTNKSDCLIGKRRKHEAVPSKKHLPKVCLLSPGVYSAEWLLWCRHCLLLKSGKDLGKVGCQCQKKILKTELLTGWGNEGMFFNLTKASDRPAILWWKRTMISCRKKSLLLRKQNYAYCQSCCVYLFN